MNKSSRGLLAATSIGDLNDRARLLGAQTQRNSKTQIPNEETTCVLAEKSPDIRDETFPAFEFVISNWFGPWFFEFRISPHGMSKNPNRSFRRSAAKECRVDSISVDAFA